MARHTYSPGAALALRSKSLVYESALNYLVRAQTWTVYKVSVLRSPSPYLNLLVNMGLGKPPIVFCIRYLLTNITWLIRD